MLVLTVAMVGAFSLVFAFDTDARNLPPVLLALVLFVSVGAIVAAVACFVSLYQEDKTTAKWNRYYNARMMELRNDNTPNMARAYVRNLERGF